MVNWIQKFTYGHGNIMCVCHECISNLQPISFHGSSHSVSNFADVHHRCAWKGNSFLHVSHYEYDPRVMKLFVCQWCHIMYRNKNEFPRHDPPHNTLHIMKHQRKEEIPFLIGTNVSKIKAMPENDKILMPPMETRNTPINFAQPVPNWKWMSIIWQPKY